MSKTAMILRRSPACMECGRCFDLSEGDHSKAQIEHIAREVIRQIQSASQPVGQEARAVVGVSVRHVHLTRDTVAALFGPGHEIQKMRDLYQPGQFAAKETVTVVGPRMRAIERVRVLGPLRNHTQVELSRTDGFTLGQELPVRGSGDITGTPSATLVGPYGAITLREGAIRADRHVHMSPEEAAQFRFQNGEIVKGVVLGDKELVFGRVRIRVTSGFKMEFHIDTDDANAADLSCGDEVVLVKA